MSIVEDHLADLVVVTTALATNPTLQDRNYTNGATVMELVKLYCACLIRQSPPQPSPATADRARTGMLLRLLKNGELLLLLEEHKDQLEFVLYIRAKDKSFPELKTKIQASVSALEQASQAMVLRCTEVRRARNA